MHLDAAHGQFAIDSLGPEGRHDPVAIRVVLDEDAGRTGDIVQLRARALAARVGDIWHALAGEGVRLTVGGAVPVERLREWRAGRVLVMPAVFRRPARYLNDGVPDFESDLALDGTSLLGTVKSGLVVQVERRGTWLDETAAAIRAHVRRAVSHHVGAHDPLAGAVTTAILIGDRTGLPDEVRRRLQDAGVYHVIAISGGNIAILAGIVLAALAVAGVRGRAAAAATLLVVAGYSLVATAGPSVWRATLMAVIYLAARALDHRTPTWHAVSLAAAVIVVVRPLDVRDAGFVLTFGATVALVEAARRTAAFTRPAGQPGHHVSHVSPRRAAAVVWTKWLAPSVIASVAVEIVLLPVSAYVFSRVTVAGLVLNLVAVPMMTLVQTAGLVVALADSWPLAAGAAGQIANWSATALVESARLVELVPGVTWRVPPPHPALLIVYYSGLGAFLLPWRRLRPAGGTLAAISALAMTSGAIIRLPASDALRESILRLTVFDVGQAEALLLEPPGGGSLLVDAGGVAFGAGGFDIGSRVLAPALWARGIVSLDALLVTHGDPDHVGGADTLVEDFAPVRLWMGVDVPSHEPTGALVSRARRAGAEVSWMRLGDTRQWGKARLRVLHPPDPDWERPRVRNDDSVVLEVTYGETAILLTGDISAEVERAIVPHLSPARVRILKVAHHGSRTSTGQFFLDMWPPTIAVISCGRGNRFGHPAPEVIERLESVGARVLRTDRDGQITIETDGRDVKVRTFVR
jgi:competence protein ComEC